MIRLDYYNILQPRHLVESRLGGMHDLFSARNLDISQLHMFKSQAMCCATNEHLARLDLRETLVSTRSRYPCNFYESMSSNVSSGKPRHYALQP
jgi:hypothetical protein